jgi:hypothetical protein
MLDGPLHSSAEPVVRRVAVGRAEPVVRQVVGSGRSSGSWWTSPVGRLDRMTAHRHESCLPWVGAGVLQS